MSDTDVFVVVRSRGPAWVEGVEMTQQSLWNAHAAFMNSLVTSGELVLGGPLEATGDVLLVVRAPSAAAAKRVLDSDPWASEGVLRVSLVSRWTLRLGNLPASTTERQR